MRAASLLALGCAASVYAQDDAESADASASIEALLPEFTVRHSIIPTRACTAHANMLTSPHH